MIISLIVALSSNRVIGINNQLPWKLSHDLAWFKKQTMDKTIIMGRKTWESLPFRPLPGRKHIIISRNPEYKIQDHKANIIESVHLTGSIEDALTFANENEEQEVMFIGGAMIYEQALPLCHKLYLTMIKQEFEGDAFFPDYMQFTWKKSFIEKHKTDSGMEYDFMIMEKL